MLLADPYPFRKVMESFFLNQNCKEGKEFLT